MGNLKKAYTDTRGRTHKVEHIVVQEDDTNSRERIVEELFRILNQAGE